MSNEAESKHYEEFGQLLGECFARENDLSNVTYAVLNVIPDFKRDFINFFLNLSQQLENIEDITVEREFQVMNWLSFFQKHFFIICLDFLQQRFLDGAIGIQIVCKGQQAVVFFPDYGEAIIEKQCIVGFQVDGAVW